jgi:hypothetical protein
MCPSATRSVGTWSGCSTSGSAARSGPVLPSHDLQTPRLTGCEERVWIDVVEPTDEVLLGLVVRRPVDGAATRVELHVEIVATAFECREALLDGRSFRVALSHP